MFECLMELLEQTEKEILGLTETRRALRKSPFQGSSASYE